MWAIMLMAPAIVAGDCPDQYVPVLHVCELMTQDSPELVGRECLQDSLSNGERRMLRVPACRERIRLLPSIR